MCDLRYLKNEMKCQITSMLDYDVENGFNDVNVCFLITATPIAAKEDEISEEELNRLILEGGDISELANKSNISPFRTILFPNSSQIANAFLNLIETNEKREEEGKKPIYPTINLARFEKETPEPYFRRYVNDSDTEAKAGDWIIAENGDETLPNDPLKRKVFRTVWVTSVCKTENGIDIPTENVTRKAARAYTNGLTTDAGSGKMICPCAQQLKLEEKKAEANKPKQNDQEGGDTLLTNEFESKSGNRRRKERVPF
jgi:hypothetical protein